jgi:proteasome alpha subunit|tara:strand:- start:348 stop:1103 length:756 start_codon:yes stop_codon:yes gene_type:complete
MLEEPYRWVEAINNRREYLEDQLSAGSPVVGMTYAGGVLLLTTTPGPRKLFEIYNEIAFAAVGHPADIEKLRKAVIDIAHIEGFNLSARDVTLQRLVSFGIGPLMKAAFDEIFRSPFIARVMMAELDPVEGGDVFYTIDADGSFAKGGRVAAISGSEKSARAMTAKLGEVDGALPLQEALGAALQVWGLGRLVLDSEEGQEPSESDVREFLKDGLQGLKVEAAVLDRERSVKSKFNLLTEDELPLAAYIGA